MLLGFRINVVQRKQRSALYALFLYQRVKTTLFIVVFILLLNDAENIPLSENIIVVLVSFTRVSLAYIQRYRQLADRGWPLDSNYTSHVSFTHIPPPPSTDTDSRRLSSNNTSRISYTNSDIAKYQRNHSENYRVLFVKVQTTHCWPTKPDFNQYFSSHAHNALLLDNPHICDHIRGKIGKYVGNRCKNFIEILTILRKTYEYRS